MTPARSLARCPGTSRASRVPPFANATPRRILAKNVKMDTRGSNASIRNVNPCVLEGKLRQGRNLYLHTNLGMQSVFAY